MLFQAIQRKKLKIVFNFVWHWLSSRLMKYMIIYSWLYNIDYELVLCNKVTKDIYFCIVFVNLSKMFCNCFSKTALAWLTIIVPTIRGFECGKKKNYEYIFYLRVKKWFPVVTSLLRKEVTPPSCLFLSERISSLFSIWISEDRTESSNFVSEMPITAASLSLAIYWS